MTQQENQAIFSQQHRQWLHDPTTKAFAAALLSQEQSIVGKLTAAAMDSDKDSEHVRRLGVQLLTIRTIEKLLNETDSFVSKCSTC